ncbi:3-oxoacyl-ACP synthase [Pendulispora rubella]|uniref:3-oxoacyl-ACP synthase n=1 Tax=Pendulispora rubella TaxID=2741070 RepID=A0ABZ2LHU8_9BACT
MAPVRGAAIVAYGAISALGEGPDASCMGTPGEPARTGIAVDDELTRASFARPFAARAQGGPDAGALLRRALLACVADLDRALPEWRSLRVGLSLATSAGGMRGAEKLFATLRAGHVPSRQEAVDATYFAPMVSVFSEDAPVPVLSPATLVLTACSASTLAIGLGLRWLEHDACDLVLAGGFDSVSTFVASGFEALRATTAQPPPRPFCVGRDGMALGEGAALLALVHASSPSARARAPLAFVSGFGASADAVHITAPDRTGQGLARAASAALADAGVDPASVDLVSAHATATPFNDAAEWHAMKRAMPEATPVVHPAKAQIGHTLGAAGALETLTCVEAIRRSVLPATAHAEGIDPGFSVRLLARAETAPVATALKLSAAFGGANASLVVTRAAVPGSRRRPRDAYLSRAVHVDALPDLAVLAELTQVPPDKLSRTDALCRFALAAVAALQAKVGPLAGAGVVVGHFLATLETNATYDARVRERGVSAEPRRFPYTSPNAVAGECGVVFGLSGPGLAVSSGLHGAVEALAAAAELVRAGDADRMVVVAVDEVAATSAALAAAAGYPAPQPGAIALVVSSEPAGYAQIDRIQSAFIGARTSSMGPPGHLALRPLVSPEPPAEVQSASPWGFAKLTLIQQPG